MTRTLLQQALGALHPQANRAFVEATKDALRSALAAPQPEPVAYVPRCHTDGNYCIVGEYKWDEIEEKPFGLADPAHWECAALYAAPPAAPAPAVPDDAALNTLAKLFHNGEEIEGDNGAAMMVDMALWHEASEAFDSLIGEGDDETLASSAAPAVREPLTDAQIDKIFDDAHENMPKGELFRTFVTRAIERAHGIGGGGK